MSASIESFVTARLAAEQIAPMHLGEICRLHRDPRVMKTLSADGTILPDAVTRDRLQQEVEHWEQHGFGLWVFRHRSDGRFIGRGGLKRYRIEDQSEIGLAYAVLSDYWGQGFATEMAEASLGIGFEELGFPEVASWTLPANRASQRVMAKLGFRYEREFLFAGLPHLFYRLSASQWRQCRRGAVECSGGQNAC